MTILRSPSNLRRKVYFLYCPSRANLAPKLQALVGFLKKRARTKRGARERWRA